MAVSLRGSAHAQPKAAAEMDEQARAYYRAGAFEQGAEAFQKAYELEAKSGRLFNAGRAYEEAGNKRKASELFGRFLLVEKSGDKVTEARARKAKLDTEIADEDALAAQAAAKEAREQEARMLADQAHAHLRSEAYQKAAAAFESAFAASGDTEFVYEKAEALRLGAQYPEAIAEYIRYQREAPEGRNLDLSRTRQRELEQEATRSTKTQPADAGKVGVLGAEPSASSTPRDAGSSTMRISGMVGVGIGVALLGTAGIFALDASSKEDELQKLSPTSMDSWNQTLYDEGKDAANAAIGLSVLGGVAVLTGATLFFLGRGSDDSAKRELSVAPALSEHGGGFALRGRFE